MEHLKNTKGVVKLGIHGESIGGIIASHVAANYNVDFAFIDRGVSSISDLIFYNFGIIFKILFKICLIQDSDASINYLKA